MIGPDDPVGGAAAEQAARGLLRQAAFHRDDPSYLQRVTQWFVRQLSAVAGGRAGPLVTTVLVALIAALIGYAVLRAGSGRRRARQKLDTAEDPLRRDRDIDHRAAAAGFEAERRWAEAMREWLRATLATIEDRGVLLPRPGRTGAAVAREAGPLLPDADHALHRAAVAFDEIWFGGRTASTEDARLAREADAAVRSARHVAGADARDRFALPR